MKKITLLLFCGTALLGFSQNSRGLHLAGPNNLPSKPATEFSLDAEKTLLCQDTLRYPQAKEQILGTSNFYTFDIWQADNEGFSQTFLNSGSVILRGVEFFGMNNTVDGTPSVTVTASIYNVNAGFTPTTLITSGTVSFTTTTAGYHFVTFASPVTVTGNYAVVIQATNTGGVFTTYVNDAAPAQSYDELYARFKSSYVGYASSSGNWITIPAFTEIGSNNFEALLAPMVSYTLNAGFTASPTTACLGTPITFTNTTTPTAFLTNRMYNYQIFRTFFGTAPSDSTYVYDYDNLSPLAWGANATYTYPAAGSYSVDMGVNGGFWNSCFDIATQPITINALPVVTASPNSTICPGSSASLTANGAVSYLWNNGAGSGSTVSVSPASTTTYTVTGTAANTCQNSAQVTVTVAPLDNATFVYSSSTLCSGGGNVIPTTNVAGTFNATPAGLNFVNTSTGEINMTTSADGTYSVSYSTSGACPNSSTQNITITAAPDASFTYSQGTFCSANADPSPVFGSGASGGAFSSTAGLVINASNGIIDLSASTAGTYVVTNTIAAAGACPMADETFTVVVNPSATAAVTGGGQLCGTGSIPVTVNLTGGGPWSITYSDGTTPTTVTGIVATPYTINATSSGNYTVTSVTQGTCSNAGTGSATTTFFSNPTVIFDIPSPSEICEGGAVVGLVGSPAGGMFSGVGVVGSSFDPTGLNAGSYGLSYNYTDGNGCSGSAGATILIHALPNVTLGSFADLCIYNSAITLTGGLPAGGIYQGTGVSAGSFDPAVAGLGTQTISYTFIDINGCQDVAAQDILVDECLGLEEIESFDVLIAPNPASESFVIMSNGKNALTFTVLTEDGKVVREPKTITNGTSETVSVQGFAKGIYFVRFVSATQISTKKLIVN